MIGRDGLLVVLEWSVGLALPMVSLEAVEHSRGVDWVAPMIVLVCALALVRLIEGVSAPWLPSEWTLDTCSECRLRLFEHS